MPKPRRTRAHVHDALQPSGLSENVGLHGVPGINLAGGWDDPAFRHISVIAMEMRDAGVEMTRETMEAIVKLGRARHAAGRTPEGFAPPLVPIRPFPSREQMAAEGVVYYVRRGEFIKIGTTMRLKNRMAALVPDEVLAVEPGSFPLESQLHKRFAHLRAPFMREYFRIEPELIDHIAKVVELHGPPPAGLLTFGETDEPETVAR